MTKTYESLEVWKNGINLAIEIYGVTKKFPKEEIYGLTSQLRRAVISISANIAEGSGRSSNKEFVRFINIAIGSLNEVESLIFVSKNLNFVSKEDFMNLTNLTGNLGNLLGGFKRFLINKQRVGREK